MSKKKQLHAQPKPKAKAKASPKPKPKPKVRKTEKRKEHFLAGQMRKRDFEDCLQSAGLVRNYVQEGLDWSRIIGVVDRLLARVIVLSPGLFTAEFEQTTGTLGLPAVSPCLVRALWLLQLQHFFVNKKVISTTNATILGFTPPTTMLPVALAKLAQYFCPFFDVSTNTEYSVVLPAMPYTTILDGYPSVDDQTSDISCVNRAADTYLLTPYRNGTECEVSTNTKKVGGGYQVPGSTSIFDAVSKLTSQQVNEIVGLCAVVDMDTIRPLAPDASINGNLSLEYNKVFSTSPYFDPGIIAMLCSDNTNLVNAMFSASIPYCRAKVSINGTNLTPSAQAATFPNLRTCLHNIYVFYMIRASWNEGPWWRCLLTTPWNAVRSLNAIGMPINPWAVSDAIGQLQSFLYGTSTATGINANTAYGFVAGLWSAFINRAAKTDIIVDCGNRTVGQRYSPYAIGQTMATLRVPQPFKVLDNMGASVMNGVLMFPYFPQDYGGVITSLSAVGTWTMSTSYGQSFPAGKTSCSSSQAITVTSPNGASFTYLGTRAYVPCLTYFSTYFTTLLSQNPVYPYSQGLQFDEGIMGNHIFSTTPVNAKFVQIANSNTGFVRTWGINRTALLCSLCTPYAEALLALSYSPFVSIDENIRCVATLPAVTDVQDTFFVLATELISLVNPAQGTNSYAATFQALRETKNKPRVKDSGILKVKDNSANLSRAKQNNVAALDAATNNARIIKGHHEKTFMSHMLRLGKNFGSLAWNINDPFATAFNLYGLGKEITSTFGHVGRLLTDHKNLVGTTGRNLSLLPPGTQLIHPGLV